MNRAGHVRLGLAAGAVTSVALGGAPLHWAVGTLLAVGSCQGPASPDADQSWLRWLGPHRGPTHDVAWPVLAAGLMGLGGPWWAWYLLAGWVSHLVADMVAGEDPWGVPVFGLFRVGLGGLSPGRWMFPTGGRWELWSSRLILLAAMAWATQQAVWPTA